MFGILFIFFRNEDSKTGNDVREISGEEPTRAEGRLVEITNTWRDVKRGEFTAVISLATYVPSSTS